MVYLGFLPCGCGILNIGHNDSYPVDMKILFVLEYYSPHLGGAETLFKNLAEGLVRKRHSVAVLTSWLSDTEMREQVKGVRLFRVKTPNRGRRYWFTLLAIPMALKLAKETDVISTTTYNGAFPAWLAGKIRRKPAVITVHEILGTLWGEFQGMNRFMAWLHRFLERRIIGLGFDRYVGVSNATAEAIRACGKDAVTVYNGIDYKLFKPRSGKRLRQFLKLDDLFIYLSYGRPGISKGIEYLVRAVRLIRDAIPNSMLLLFLAEEPRDRHEMIMGLIPALGIGDSVQVRLPVPREMLPPFIAASDCVVVPSLSEGFGFSAAEACAMGKPVVASGVGSLPEVVSGQHVLVEPRDPKAIARGVIRVHRGEATESAPKKFTWAKCVRGYEQIYGVLTK